MRGGVLLDRCTGKPVVDPDLQRRLDLLGRERVVDELELGALLPHLQMAEVNPPLYMDVSNAYSGDELGLPYRDIMGEGVVSVGDLAVTAHGGANSVDVAAGAAWVKGDTDANAQPTYRMRNDAAVNLGVTPDPSNPRYVVILAQIIDATFAGGSRVWQLQALHGTPAGAPAVPAVPASALALATILVPAAAASSAAYTITDTRGRAAVGGGLALAPAMFPIYDTVLGGAVATIDILTIPQIYRHLVLEVAARGDAATTGLTLQARFNNDSGANYSGEFLTGNAATVTAGETLGATSARIGRLMGNTAPANGLSGSLIHIPNYAGTTGHKAGTGQSSSREGTTTGLFLLEHNAYVWFAAAAAINRITLFPSSGNFMAGSRFTLYGHA